MNSNFESLDNISNKPELSLMSKVPASWKTNRSTPAAFPLDNTFLTSSLMRRYSFAPALQWPQRIQDMIVILWFRIFSCATSKVNYIHTYCKALAGRQPMRGRRHGHVTMHISSLLLLLETAKSTIYSYRVEKL